MVLVYSIRVKNNKISSLWFVVTWLWVCRRLKLNKNVFIEFQKTLAPSLEGYESL